MIQNTDTHLSIHSCTINEEKRALQETIVHWDDIIDVGYLYRKIFRCIVSVFKSSKVVEAKKGFSCRVRGCVVSYIPLHLGNAIIN